MTKSLATRRQMLQMTFAAAAGLALLDFTARADEPKENPVVKMFSGKLETADLGDGLHMVSGGGGNVLVSHSGDGILVIDTGVSFRAKDYLAVMAALAPAAKRKLVFNTHWHMDHTGGNADFAAAGYLIAASNACRQRMSQKITMEDMGMTSEPSPVEARPVITFEEAMDLFEGSAAHVIKFAPAHTDTDAAIIFAEAGVLHTGDLHFNGTYPVIDRSTGGSLDGMIAATRHLLELCDGKMRVVPGHGPLGDKSTLTEQLGILTLTHDRLAPFAAKKATLEEVLAKAPLADQDDKWGRGFLRSPMYTRMAYGQWAGK